MAEVTIRDLRNHGGEVLQRVEAGERLVVTRSGRPVAELRPVVTHTLTSEALLARWRHVPEISFEALRRDIDAVLDPDL